MRSFSFQALVFFGLSLVACSNTGDSGSPVNPDSQQQCEGDECASVVCGTGTYQQGNQCLPDNSVSCGPGTTEQAGICVATDTTTCGSGTTLQDGVCIPEDNVTCGSGTVEIDGECVVEPVSATAPILSITSWPTKLAVDEAGYVTFSSDIDANWQVEAGGAFPGDGTVLDSGVANSSSATSGNVDASMLSTGSHELRLYAWDAAVASPTSYVVEVMSLRVVGDLRVRLLMGTWDHDDATMTRQLMEQDDRIADVSSTSYPVNYTYDAPELSELQQYDVVVVGWNDCMSSSMRTEYGNVLAAYLDSGGAVVYWQVDGLCHISGAFLSGGYSATSPGPTATALTDAASVVVLQTGHEILNGVASLATGYRPNFVADSGSTIVAEWSDGAPLVVTRDAVVGLGVSAIASDTTLSGDWATLIVNAAVYAVGAATE